MLTIPEYISVQFNNVLRQKAIPESFHVHYRKWLRYFLDFCEKHPLPEDKSERIRLFIEKLKSKKQTPQQCTQAAHSVSLFFESQQVKNRPPSEAIRGKRFNEWRCLEKSKYIPLFLSRQEIDIILSHLEYPFNTVVGLLYGCGLRLFKCIGLRVQNFNFEDKILTVYGKGDKDRTIPLPRKLTAVHMAIPMLYAHWEGYVRETCQLYLEYIESCGIKIGDLRSDLVGYLWTSTLKPLTGGLNFARKKAVAELALRCLQNPVKFEESERAINTRSNLNFDVLEDIAAHLCLDISPMLPLKRHLNALVHLRNHIAHGSRPHLLGYSHFQEHASFVIELMEGFECSLARSLEDQNYCTVSP